MRRRQFIASSGVVTAGLAGCTALLGTDDERDDPDTVVRDFVEAMDKGDVDAANELVHEDSPEGEVTEESVAFSDTVDMSVEETEVLEKNDDTAKVRVVVTVSDGSDSQQQESTFELRTQDGEWKIWEEVDEGGEVDPPQAGVSLDSDSEANTITVTFQYNQDADYVEVTVDADDAPGWEDDGRLEEVGESDTFHTGSDGSYQVTVTAYKGDQSAVLMERNVEL